MVNLHETTQDLIDHLNSCHGHSLKIGEKTFDNCEEFMKWKETEEKMGKSWFVKQRGDRRTKHYKTPGSIVTEPATMNQKAKGSVHLNPKERQKRVVLVLHLSLQGQLLPQGK